jgi:hypothetical protein
MSKHDYIAQIAHKIDAHRQTIAALQREIDKLEGAAEVIAQLRGSDNAVLTLDAMPEKKVSAAYVIRKKIERQRQKFEPVKSAAIKSKLLDIISAKSDGLAEIADRMGYDRRDKQPRNRVWYTLDKMIKAGEIAKDGPLYIMPKQEEAHAD